METPGDTQTNTIVEIAPDGDLILIVGPEEAKLHVDSKFLTVGSRPFSKMFGPHWKEGQALRDRDGPAEVSLRDGDAAALKIVCSILHHQNREVQQPLSAGQVLAVAVVADEYDFVQALRFASDSWLRPSRGDAAGDLMLLAAAAYLFRNERAFKEITKALILDYDGSYLTLSCREVEESAMPWQVFCKYRHGRVGNMTNGQLKKGLLEEQRATARLKAADILIEGVNDVTGLCVHKCGWTSKYAYAYMKLLEKEELWPKLLTQKSISKALESAERMPDPIPEESSAACAYGYKHAAPAYRRNRAESLDSFYKRIGLCLQCVRSGSKCSNCSQPFPNFEITH